MIGRRDKTLEEKSEEKPKGFDDFDFKLGDMMRGERATLGKSLLDVQRDLKIKAAYIAAIENADADAFETKGFIAGYVRSYARYLNIDPEWAYETFSRESGFALGNGLERAKTKASPAAPLLAASKNDATFGSELGGALSFTPQSDGILARIEPGAVGSILVMLTLLGAIGYGAVSVLHEVQQVRVTPMESAPGVLAELDPLQDLEPVADATAFNAPNALVAPEALNRLYRPQALDVPVMTPRDGPIAALDPQQVGVLSARTDTLPTIETGAPGEGSALGRALADQSTGSAGAPGPIVLAENAPEVMLVAVDEAWVRVRDADGSILLEKILQAGDSFVLPRTERPATLRAGAAGNLYFMVNGETYGPAGSTGAVVSNVALSSDDLTQTFAKVDEAEGAQSRAAVRFAEAALLENLSEESQ